MRAIKSDDWMSINADIKRYLKKFLDVGVIEEENGKKVIRFILTEKDARFAHTIANWDQHQNCSCRLGQKLFVISDLDALIAKIEVQP